MRAFPSAFRSVPLAAPVSLLAGAVAVAAGLPLVWNALLPVPAPGHSVDVVLARRGAALALAGLALVAGLALLVLRFRQAPAGTVAREATALVVACGFLAIACASPLWDAHVAGALREARYESDSVLTPFPPFLNAFGLRNSAPGAVFETPLLTRENHSGPVTLGPIPMTRGDRWLVSAGVTGTDPDAMTVPTLVAPGARCELGSAVDARLQEGGPRYGAFWYCSALESGETTITITPGTPVARAVYAQASVLPTMHTLHMARVDGVVTALAAVTGLATAALAAWRAQHVTDRADRARLLAAAGAGLGLAALVWVAAVLGSHPDLLARDRGISILARNWMLVVAACVGTAGAAAWFAWQRPAARTVPALAKWCAGTGIAVALMGVPLLMDRRPFADVHPLAVFGLALACVAAGAALAVAASVDPERAARENAVAAP